MNIKSNNSHLPQIVHYLKAICLGALLITLSMNDVTFAQKTSDHSADQKVRIVSLGGGVTETLFALGLGKDIVAVDVSSLYPPQALKKPKVGYLRATSAEGIASMRPTHVIASEAIGPVSVKSQLKDAGIKLSLVPEVSSIQGAIERIKAIGVLAKRSEQASAMIKQIESALAQPVTQKKKPKVLFLFSHGGGQLMVGGLKTGSNTMINAAGGINAISAYEGYRPLTAEAVVVAKPDIILLTERSMKSIQGPKELWKLPGLSLTPAGKKQRVIVMEDLKLLGFGPRTGEAILELKKLFHK